MAVVSMPRCCYRPCHLCIGSRYGPHGSYEEEESANKQISMGRPFTATLYMTGKSFCPIVFCSSCPDEFTT